MINDFKKFIMRGNVVDMAVGIIIGAAFGAIVKSLVADVIMPPIGVLMNDVDFSQLYYVVKGDVAEGTSLEDAKKAGASVISYGVFINAVINFLIVGFAVFMMVRFVNKLQRQPPPADPTTKECPECLSTIPIKATRCAHCAVEVKDAA